MAGAARAPEGAMASINVTPLVDVVLVLLIVLMVTANYLASRSIPLELPKGATGSAQTKSLAVSIDRDGKLYVDAQPADEPTLRARAKGLVAEGAEARAIIAADGKTPHAHVVRVMDLLRAEHVTRVAVQIEPER